MTRTDSDVRGFESTAQQNGRLIPSLPCDIHGRDLAAVAVPLGEEELPARRVPAHQVAVAAPGHQQAVLHHKPGKGMCRIENC